MKRLPPIFARYRFSIPRDMQPGVVLVITREMDNEATDIVEALDAKDAPIDYFKRWWVEYGDMAVLADHVGDGAFTLKAFGKRNGPDKPFAFRVDMISAKEEMPLTDVQKIVAASYVRACILLNIYTAREREVSVNTLTRNKPRAWMREGDTLRFAPLDSLASAAGQHRQRGYVPPDDPSGIRMREHDVRGHWRTYASGVRVWVRPHKRGDAELGRVERVIG